MATKKVELVEIKPIDLQPVQVTIIGDTPLIMHAWSEKAKKQMLEAQMGKSKGKAKEHKSPAQDFIDSMYWLMNKPDTTSIDSEEGKLDACYQAIQDGAKFGFPVTALKQAAISASYRKGWTRDKMSLRGVFFIDGGYGDFMEILSDAPVMREDMVRVGMGVADIRYRGEFRNWKATFTLKYDVNGQFPLSSIINMLNAGGTVCGLGEWRTERDGQFGMFHVETL